MSGREQSVVRGRSFKPMVLLERGYTLSEAYALWRQRAATMRELGERREDDAGDDAPSAGNGSDEE
jgi:hypothetical protein